MDKITGDPTEAALVVSAEKIGLKVENAGATSRASTRFRSSRENQFMATLNNRPDASPRIILKGAPEVILKRCDGIDPAPVLAEVSRLASCQGMRVLAIAAKPHGAERPLADGRHVRRVQAAWPAGNDRPAAERGHRGHQDVPRRPASTSR